jgi:hypothetical protein
MRLKIQMPGTRSFLDRLIHSAPVRRWTLRSYAHPEETLDRTTRQAAIVGAVGAVVLYLLSWVSWTWIPWSAVLTSGSVWILVRAYQTYVSNRASNVYMSERRGSSPTLRAVRASTSDVACLMVQGNMPVLKLMSPDPYQRGWCHGYLMQPEICVLVERFRVLDRLRLFRYPLPNQYTIPSFLRYEMKGLVDGYNKAAFSIDSDTTHIKPLDIETVIRYHMLPDSKQYAGIQSACTCILMREPSGRLTFARHMDWLPFGAAGSTSLLIQTPRCAYWSPPGFVGVVTGINPAGLCLAMNVFPGERLEHPMAIPVALANRILLENYATVQGVIKAMTSRAIRPLGAYHLTVCDVSGDQATVSYGKEVRVDTRWMGRRRRSCDPRVGWRAVTNQNPWTGEECFDSSGRLAVLHANPPDHRSDVERLLQDSTMNTFETVHHMIFYPVEQKVYYSADNGFAACRPALAFDYSQLWGDSVSRTTKK